MTTFAPILQRLLAAEPGRPLVTYYDLDSGERTELSVTTYANWVAKVASLLSEEFDLERGQRLLIDLPTHWLGPIALGAAWTLGVQVQWPSSEAEPDAVLCDREGLASYDPAQQPVLASALHPLGLAFPDGVPSGVHDLGKEVWSQPDSFVAWDPPEGDDLALDGVSYEELWRGAAADTLDTGWAPGGRLLSDANPASVDGLRSFTAPFAQGGSVVWVRDGDHEARSRTAAAERTTARWPNATV